MTTTLTIGTATAYAYNEIAFAFNPLVIKITGATAYTRASVEVAGNGNQYTETRAIFADGTCWFDMRAYVQALFDDDYQLSEDTQMQQTGRGIEVTTTITLTDGTTPASGTTTTFIVWGAMDYGEEYNAQRRIKWFTAFPFTFGLFAQGNSHAALSYVGDDGSAIDSELLDITADGVWQIKPSVVPLAKELQVTQYGGSDLVRSTFDDTYDITFRYIVNNPQAVKIYVETDDCEKGVYLRWINRHGFYCYWLFENVDEQIKTETDGEFLRNNMGDAGLQFGFVGNVSRRQSYASAKVIPCCVPLCDEETWRYLFDIAISPVVDMYMGKDEDDNPMWLSVSAQAGSYARTDDVLQDFAVNIVMPETPNLKL